MFFLFVKSVVNMDCLLLIILEKLSFLIFLWLIKFNKKYIEMNKIIIISIKYFIDYIS